MNGRTFDWRNPPPWPVPEANIAERAVLSSVMLNRNAFPIAQDALQAHYFHKMQHRLIWEAIEALGARGAAIDHITVREELQNRGRLADIGGAAAIGDLLDGAVKSSNVEHYAGLVCEAHRLRQLMEESWSLIEQASTESDTADDLLAKAERRMRELAAGVGKQDQKDGAAIAALLWERMSYADEHGGVPSLATGFYDLDQLTTGLHPGELVVLAGQTSMGKTSLAGAIAWNAAKSGRVVFFATIEMTTEDVGLRLACLEARVSFTRAKEWYRLPQAERNRVMEAVAKLETSAIVMDDTPRTLQDIRRGARQVFARQGKLDLVVVDHLSHIRPNPGRRTDNRVREMGEMTCDLKALAKELRVPVLLLAQLNRSAAQRQDKRPQLSDLRDSGEIEQDADVVLLIYRPEKDTLGQDNVGHLYVAKQRNGPLAQVDLAWDGASMRYSNLER